MAKQAGSLELRGQDVDALTFVEVEIAPGDVGLGQEITDDPLMHGGVLAHVEPAQVGAEDRERTLDRLDRHTRELIGPVGSQRLDDGVEVADQFVERLVAGERDARGRAREFVDSCTEDVAAEGMEPGVHPAQRAPVGLVGSEGRVVARRISKIDERLGRRDQARRHRELDRQAEDLIEMVLERDGRLLADGQSHHVGGDERIAVTVATDP